jgi:glycerol-3-phosphate dehydrogenase subunit B
VTDLLIVGEGLCGLFAAILASEHGVRTTLVAQGRGGLSSSHGCVDVWKGGLSTERKPELPADHPYRLAGWSNIERALRAFLVITSRAAITYRGSVEKSLMLPTAIGGLHSTCLAPESLARGDISERTTTFSVGTIEGFRDFSGRLVRDNLARSGESAPDIIPLPIIGDIPRRDLYAHDLAARFDDAEWRGELARAWKPRLGGVRLLGVPAVLGLLKPAEVLASLEERLNVRIFEIPTLPPSVPGLRLERLLRRTALAAGVQIIEGSRSIGVVDGRSAGRQVAGVVVQSAGGPRTFSAGAVLLATGGVLHGGLVARQSGRIVESVFDLPVRSPASRADWTTDKPLGAQPYASFGVRVDSEMRPVSDEGDPYYSNLYAAGGLLAGSDRTAEGSRQGIGLLTAYRAVEAALGEPLS